MRNTASRQIPRARLSKANFIKIKLGKYLIKNFVTQYIVLFIIQFIVLQKETIIEVKLSQNLYCFISDFFNQNSQDKINIDKMTQVRVD